MAYKVTTNTFYSDRGNRYDIELWSQSLSAVTGKTFTTSKGGFKLSYKGSEDRKNVVMPSELTFQYITHATASDSIFDEIILKSILSSDSEEWFLIVKRNFVVFWWGGIEAGFDSIENDFYPYSVTIKANDYLGSAVNRKDYISISDASRTKVSNYTAKMYTDHSGIITNDFVADTFPLGENELLYRFNNRWKPNNIEGYGTTYNSLSLLAVDQKSFIASSNESNKYYPAKAFKDCLKSLGLKMFQADGKINIVQNYSLAGSTIDFTNVKYSDILTQTGTGYVENYALTQEVNLDNSATPTINSGFIGQEWIDNPVDLTSGWTVQGGTITGSNSWNSTSATTNVRKTLQAGQYRISYSCNDTSITIRYVLSSGGGLQTLLTESGEVNFELSESGSLYIYSSTSSGAVTFDNIGLQKGVFAHRTFLNGQQWRFERPLSIVRGTFSHGQDFAQANSNFPSNTDEVNYSAPPYASALTSIGAFSTAAADSLVMRINVFSAEYFDFTSAANNVTHIAGSITLKLKIGSYYLTGTVGGDLSWTLSTANFIVNIPIEELSGNIYSDGFPVQSLNTNCQSFIPNESRSPFYAGTGSAAYIGTNRLISLPSVGAGGDVQLQFVASSFNYYTDPDTSNPNTSPTPITLSKPNLAQQWYTGGIYEPNYTAYFQISFSGSSLSEQGIEFSASSSQDNFEEIDFGELPIGMTGNDNSTIYSLLAWDGTSYQQPSTIQVEGTGTTYNMCSLLLDEYIKPQSQPMRIIEGDLLINDFSAFKTLDVYIGSTTTFDSDNEGKYTLIQGTFTAESDIFSGSYYRNMGQVTGTVNLGTVKVPNTYSPPINPPNPEDPTEPTFSPYKTIQNLNDFTTSTNITTPSDNLLDVIKFNSLGLLSTQITAGAAIDRVILLNNSRSQIFDNQKLMLYRSDYSNPIELTKSGATTTSTGTIIVDSFTPSVTYKKGSILALVNYDINNNITTGGGGSPSSPDTSVQYNDSGTFKGDADFVYDEGNDRLTVPKVNTPILQSISGGTTLHQIYTASQNMAILSDTSVDVYLNGGNATAGSKAFQVRSAVSGSIVFGITDTGVIRAIGNKIQDSAGTDVIDMSTAGTTIIEGNTQLNRNAPATLSGPDADKLILSSIDDLEFKIASGGASSKSFKFINNTTEVASINSSGDLQIDGTISNSAGTSIFSNNVVIGTVDSVSTGLSIGEASPTIQLFDTTNDAKLLIYSQDSSSVIGTYSNHALLLYTNSTQALSIDTSQNTIFAGVITVSGNDIKDSGGNVVVSSNGSGVGTFTGNLSGNAATVTTNANLTGDVTSSGNTATMAAVQTNITTITNAALKIGRDADNLIEFDLDNIIDFRVGAGEVVRLSMNQFRPSQNNVMNLGFGTIAFKNLFLGSGATIDFNNADVVLTHSANLLTITGGDVDIVGTLDTDNLTISGTQGTNGQVLTSTGSGVSWQDSSGGGGGGGTNTNIANSNLTLNAGRTLNLDDNNLEIKNGTTSYLNFDDAGINILVASDDLDIGTFNFRAKSFTSDVATGTAPFVVSSTTEVANLQSSTTASIGNLTGEVTSTNRATVIADNVVDEANLKVSNAPTNGYVLTAQSGNTGGLTWAAQSGGGGGSTTHRSIVNCGFNDTSLTKGLFPFGSGGIFDQSASPSLQEYSVIVAPYDGYVEYVVLRCTGASGTTAITFHKQAAGTAGVPATANYSVNVSVSANTAVKATFGATNGAFSAGDIIATGYDAGTTGLGDAIATMSIVYDLDNPL